MGVAEDVIAAATGGGAAVVRMEVARLINAAVVRLSSRGRAARELARIAEAAARSDEDLDAQLDQLNEVDRQAATAQLNEALTYTGDDPDEQAATTALRQHAEELHQLLLNKGLAVSHGNSGIAVQHNTGQIVQNTGPGTLHAAFHNSGESTAGSR